MYLDGHSARDFRRAVPDTKTGVNRPALTFPLSAFPPGVCTTRRSLAPGRIIVVDEDDGRQRGGTKVRGYEGTRVRRCEGTRVRGYEGTRVRGYEGTRVRGYEVRGCEGTNDARAAGNGRPRACILRGRGWGSFCQAPRAHSLPVILREPPRNPSPWQDPWRRPKDLAGKTEGPAPVQERRPHAGGAMVLRSRAGDRAKSSLTRGRSLRMTGFPDRAKLLRRGRGRPAPRGGPTGSSRRSRPPGGGRR